MMIKSFGITDLCCRQNLNILVAILIVTLISCVNNPDNVLRSYSAPVVFNGYINGDEVSLGGNIFWQNSCKLKNDTIQMYFYSDKFSEMNRIRNGDLLRIEIYPHEDSMVDTRNILVHLARYYEANSSYNIAPKDSMVSGVKIQMHKVELAPEHGHSINIEDIYMSAPAMSGTSGQRLEITKGKITGAVE